MEVKTVEQAKIASKRTVFTLDAVLEAFDMDNVIKTDVKYLESLKNATTNEERWKIFHGLPISSKVNEQVLLDILANTSNDEERWSIVAIAFDNRKVQDQALRNILENTNDNTVRLKVYKKAPHNIRASKVKKQALREYIKHLED